MTITEAEFERICRGIFLDRDSIIEHNPLGTEEEILLWMLLSCLIHYLSLTPTEIPCFNGRPDAGVYRDALSHVLANRRAEDFDADPHINRMVNACS